MREYREALHIFGLQDGYTFQELIARWKQMLGSEEFVQGIPAIMRSQEYNAAFVILKSHLDAVEMAA